MKGPLVLIGTGRCGSTALFEGLTRHPDVYWLTRLAERAPNTSLNAWSHRFASSALVGDWARGRLRPSEGYAFWDRHYPGFSRPFRNLTARDVSPVLATAVRDSFTAMATPRRHHLLLKVTGWARAGFIRRIFPEARFVHLIRDGRPTAASFLRSPWWDGWSGPDRWRLGPLDEPRLNVWRDAEQSFAVLAGLQWDVLLESTRRDFEGMGSDATIEIRYEDLCADPSSTIERILGFGRLAHPAPLVATIADHGFRNRNDQWEHWMSQADAEALTAAIRGHLDLYGYE